MLPREPGNCAARSAGVRSQAMVSSASMRSAARSRARTTSRSRGQVPSGRSPSTGWAGAYGGGGVGGRIRYEAFPFLGLDLFGEALIVPVAHGLRHDHPIGFNLFVPFRIGQVVRLRPLLGMCVTPSFFHPEEAGAPRADTILVGAHAGGGLELALHDRLSFFLEAKAVAWFGNDRSVQGWTGAVGGEVRPFLLGQAQLGFTFHLGGA